MWFTSIVGFLQAAALVQDPEVLLPDYDCIRPKADALLQWSDWLQALQDPKGEGWLAVSRIPLSILTDNNREQALSECPIGLLMADILRMLACFDKLQVCSETFERLVRQGLGFFGLRVLMGTRWPIYESLHSDVWDRVPRKEDDPHDLACEDPGKQILNWAAFKNVFALKDWYQPSVDVAYGPELEQQWREAARECPLGFATANLVKAMLCSHTESVCFRAHATMLGAVLEEISLQQVAASGWPILRMLGHVSRVVRRHRFQLDFTPSELLMRPLPDGHQQVADASVSMQDLQVCLPKLHEAADRTATRLGIKALPLRLIYATMAHGPRFSPYVSRFIGRATALGIGAELLVFCLDAEALADCRSVNGHCIRGTPSILNKFTLPLVLLQHDLDVMWLDLDVFLFQSPTTPVVRQLRANTGLELLISGSFAVDCICSGIVLFRATESMRSWLAELLVWMYEHPYEHDQKAFSAFLRAGERVAFENELPVSLKQVPRWEFLDPETEFVSARHVDVAGWTGDPDKIVAFHLLHGDSDAADASRQFAARNGLGIGYEPLLDTFFNRTDFPELYKTPVLPHRLSSQLRDALWRSRWSTPRPQSPARCNETVPMRF